MSQHTAENHADHSNLGADDGRRRRLSVPCLLSASVALAAAASAQPTPLSPSRTLLNGDPPVIDVSFGQWLAASGPYLLVTGTDASGAVDYQGWVQGDGPEWSPFFSQGLFTNQFSETAPVALQGSLAYRHSDNLGTGFRLSRLDLADLANNAGIWTYAWDPGDSNARMRSVDASDSIFLNSRLVALGWQSGSTSHFAVLRDQDAGALTWYSDSVSGGGGPSVSADVDQVAVGLPGTGQVITLVDGTPWTQESVLNGPPSADAFGAAVALRNNLLAVSAPEADVCILPPNIGCVDSGQVWIYQRIGGIWTFATPLFNAADVTGGEVIGRSLRFSADGTRLAVGAPGASTTFLFAQDGSGNWDLLARAATSPAADDDAGAAVAFAGDGDLFVGAPGYDDGSGQVGAALLFEERIFSDDFESGNFSGWSVIGGQN